MIRAPRRAYSTRVVDHSQHDLGIGVVQIHLIGTECCPNVLFAGRGLKLGQ